MEQAFTCYKLQGNHKPPLIMEIDNGNKSEVNSTYTHTKKITKTYTKKPSK